jgi:hypothetical protein
MYQIYFIRTLGIILILDTILLAGQEPRKKLLPRHRNFQRAQNRAQRLTPTPDCTPEQKNSKSSATPGPVHPPASRLHAAARPCAPPTSLRAAWTGARAPPYLPPTSLRAAQELGRRLHRSSGGAAQELGHRRLQASPVQELGRPQPLHTKATPPRPCTGAWAL